MISAKSGASDYSLYPHYAYLNVLKDIWSTYACETGWWDYDLTKLTPRHDIVSTDLTIYLDHCLLNPTDLRSLRAVYTAIKNSSKYALSNIIDQQIPGNMGGLPTFYIKLLLIFKLIKITHPEAIFNDLIAAHMVVDMIPASRMNQRPIQIVVRNTPKNFNGLHFSKKCHYGRRTIQNACATSLPLKLAYLLLNYVPANDAVNADALIFLLGKLRHSGHMQMDCDINYLLELLNNDIDINTNITSELIWNRIEDGDQDLDNIFNIYTKGSRFKNLSALWDKMLPRTAMSNANSYASAFFHEMVNRRLIVGVKYSTYSKWLTSLSYAVGSNYTPRVMYDISSIIYRAQKQRPDELLNLNEILDIAEQDNPLILTDLGLTTWGVNTSWPKEPMPWWLYILGAIQVCHANGYDIILTLDNLERDIVRWINTYPESGGGY